MKKLCGFAYQRPGGFVALAILLPLLLVFSKVPAEDRQITKTDSDAIGVFVSQAKEQVIPTTIEAYGHVRAIQSVDLSFVVDGHLTKILAHNGERIKAGQEVAQLDDQSDQSALTSMKADLQLAQSTYERALQIQQFGGVSKQMLEADKAQVVKAKAQVQQQEVLISQKKLLAPFDGVLGMFQYSIGAYLPKGTTLVSLVQQAPLAVRYSVPATNRSELEIGQSVVVKSGSYPDKTFPGILSYISPEVNKGTGTITLEARVDNPDFLLMPGMFVSIEQTINPDRQVLVIPDVALMTDIMGQYVFVDEHHRARKVYVTVGQLVDNLAIINHGLKPGDIVVTAGQQKLDSGDRLKILQPALAGSDRADTAKASAMVATGNSPVKAGSAIASTS